MQLRYYQKSAVKETYAYMRENPGKNPCIVLPTGTGKSFVIAKIVRDAVERWKGRVLVLAHVKELLEQNAQEIIDHYPNADLGIYSAGLSKRDTTEKIIVAGIQSIYNKADQLGPFNLVIVDEAHLIPTADEGMYTQYLDALKQISPNVRIIGLTATPYRLRGGVICDPKNTLNHISYDASILDMINDGYLCKIKSRAGKAFKIDLDSVKIENGEFKFSDLAEQFDTNFKVKNAVKEMIELCKDRKKILVFCSSVSHAERVKYELEKESGEEVGLILGDSTVEHRAETIARFKGQSIKKDLFGGESGPLRWLVNVRVLTTGFNVPETDCIVMLFATTSPGLYVQVVGRGTRIAPEKKDCIVLDYGQNILRHGPLDAVRPPSDSRKKSVRDHDGKECPNCGSIISIGYQTCPDCGYIFETPRETHGYTADGTPILTGDEVIEEYEVRGIIYEAYQKRGWKEGMPKTLKISYEVFLNQWIDEWVCPEHDGWAHQKFVNWWMARTDLPVPATAAEAAFLAESGRLLEPRKILVKIIGGERFPRIVGYTLDNPFEKAYAGTYLDAFGNEIEDDEIPF